MSEQHWAKLLQVAGILIGTGLGSVILNPDVMEKWANAITRKFLAEGDSWSDTIKAIREVLPEINKIPGTKRRHITAILMALNLLVFAFSLSFEITWLVWICAGIIILALLHRVVIQVSKGIIEKYSLGEIIKRILMAWFFAIVVEPPFHLLLTVMYYCARLLVCLFHSVARKNVVRRWLIGIGFLFVLAGMVWELFLIS